MNAPAPVCPAAEVFEGPPGKGPAVLCRVMLQEQGRTDQIVHGKSVNPLLTADSDPNMVYGFCCGKGLPCVTGEEDHGHHTHCGIWQLEKDRIRESKPSIKEPKRRTQRAMAKVVQSGPREVQEQEMREFLEVDRLGA